MNQNTSLPNIFSVIVELIDDSGGFLVGGAIRDILLGIPVHDLDFALPSKTIQYAKKVADELDGEFYVLDKERETTRVILWYEGQRLIVDFTKFQGITIEEDLAARDFTITSMALDIIEKEAIIDPFQGARDLKDGVIKSTSPGALKDDPLRCLRAIRLAAQHNFQILPETLEQIRQNQAGLSTISTERIRDELFRILDGPNQKAALMALDQIGTYSIIFSRDCSNRQITAISLLEKIWSLFLKTHDQESAASWSMGVLVNRLGRFRDKIKEYLAQELVIGRSVYALSFLAPLIMFSDADDSDRIALSNQESIFVKRSTLSCESFVDICHSGGALEPVEVFQYFRDYDSAGVIGVFLGLAEIHGKDPLKREGVWLDALDCARILLDGWWEKHREWVNPPILLNGHDLIREFNLSPGPQLGRLLEKLREIQVREELKDREQALLYAGNLLSSIEEQIDD
jgi:tRNA nucleotidyltransferase/poly(A) polymerase